jgi:hypothetical protein
MMLFDQNKRRRKASRRRRKQFLGSRFRGSAVDIGDVGYF